MAVAVEVVASDVEMVATGRVVEGVAVMAVAEVNTECRMVVPAQPLRSRRRR
jgi:hypothetical protein